MNTRFKEAFDKVQADEALKESTRVFLAQQTTGRRQGRPRPYRYLAPAVCCMLFLLIGLAGFRLYFTSTSVISIDINPSVELGINRFDRVIFVEGYNEDGAELADSLKVKNLNYVEALNAVLSNEIVVSCLDSDGVLSIAVVGSSEEQKGRLLTNIESCTAGHRNMHCYSADAEEVEAAHEAGLSYGKYLAFLELQEYRPDITAEDVQGMTMREIRQLIEEASAGEDGKETESESSGEENGCGGGQRDRGAGPSAHPSRFLNGR